MGCAVAWAYWDIYRDEHLGRFVLIDQPPVFASLPDWPEGLASQVGAPHKAEDLPAFIAALRGPKADDVAAGALAGMFTADMPEAEKDAVLQQMLLTDRETASALMFSQATLDFRDLLPQITIPTLVIGGESSFLSTMYLENLSASIPGSKVHVISAADRGSHMVILENAPAVNSVIRSFVESQN
jgi:pimeloyl-ACP methyl ester carboxylesterase